MWHTPSGDRILTGSEAELFRACLASILSGLEEGQWGDNLELGITFDELTYEQKLAMLERVGSALLGARPASGHQIKRASWRHSCRRRHRLPRQHWLVPTSDFTGVRRLLADDRYRTDTATRRS
jgi:hypothetical protein